MSEAQPERNETGVKGDGDGDVEVGGVPDTTIQTKEESKEATGVDDSASADDEPSRIDKGKGKADGEGGDGEEEEEEDDAEEEADDEEEGDDDDDDEDEEDEEPRLKYARLTQYLGGVYRNGDATSAFLVAGDKMVSSAVISGISTTTVS